jgi:hypothetical protein
LREVEATAEALDAVDRSSGSSGGSIGCTEVLHQKESPDLADKKKYNKIHPKITFILRCTMPL